MSDPSPDLDLAGGTIRSALAAAAVRFAFSDTARLDAELLMAHALGVGRDTVLMQRLDDPVPSGFAGLVARRAGHEPVAYIIGTRGFWSIELSVGPGVLVPRADSETLIAAAIERDPPRTILDLGTGPGTLLLALLDHWAVARGMGIDRSAEALGYASGNARALGLSGRAAFMRGDWGEAVAATFDLIVANPPYIATQDVLPEEVRGHEPGEALFAGPDGLDAYRRLAPQLRRLLAPGGAALLEIGAGQADRVAGLLRDTGFRVDRRCDLGGHPRVLIAT